MQFIDIAMIAVFILTIGIIVHTILDKDEKDS